ncbi:MAG: hypothetical protein WDN76_12780 [Alphaproteobacteria bacterium]
MHYGRRAGGGFGRVLSADARAGLAALGYDAKTVSAVQRHVEGAGSLEDAPGVNLAALQRKGFTDPALAAIEAAAKDAFDIRAIVHPAIVGADFCRDVLGVPEAVAAGRADLLAALGFKDSEIETANAYCCGVAALARAPGLKRDDIAVFAQPEGIGAESRLAMAQAVSPFVIGDISATLPLADERQTAPLMIAAASGGPFTGVLGSPAGAGRQPRRAARASGRTPDRAPRRRAARARSRRGQRARHGAPPHA